MNRTGDDVTRPTLKLLPHQAALVDTVFDPSSKRIILLRGDVGLGKSAALIAVAARLLKDHPSARALVLVPGPLRYQFAQRLREENVPSLLVDRFVFRELLDRTTDGAIWPTGAVVVMSIDFAKQDEIRDSLAITQWDLLIVEELHTMKGARAETVQRVNADRVLLASATQIVEDGASQLMGDEITTVEWRYEQIVDGAGTPFTVVPATVMHEISFNLNEPERGLRAAAGDLERMLVADARNLEGRNLLRCLESSPPAFESALQRLVGRATIEIGSLDEPVDTFNELEPGDLAPSKVTSRNHEEIVVAAERLLQNVENIAIDSKLDALEKLLAPFTGTRPISKRILVLTEFVATLYYLAADLEEREVPCKVLHGGLSIDDRARSLELFLNEGGILVATSAVVTYGVDLSGVTDLVLYDVPRHKDAVQNILGRFNRVGRRIHLIIHVLLTDDDLKSGGRTHLLHDTLEHIAGRGDDK